MLKSRRLSRAISVQVQLPSTSALLPGLFLEDRTKGQLYFLSSFDLPGGKDTYEQARVGDKQAGEIQCEVMNMSE